VVPQGARRCKPAPHVRTLFGLIMKAQRHFGPDLGQTKVGPTNMPPENPQEGRSLPRLAIPLARNFLLAFLALREPWIVSASAA